MSAPSSCRILLVLLPLLAVQAPAAAPPTKPIAIPGTFEENRGQADPRVRFFSRRSNYTVFLTSEGAVFSLARDSGKRRAAVRLSFVGGRRDAVVVPELPLVAKTNYFKGADPSRWQTGIPNYGRVRLRGIRPGVDVLFYLRDNELEYDLVVRPGTDPDRVRVRFEGQESMAVDGAGDLVLETAAGQLVAHKPHVWQKADGKRREVPARYVLTRSREIRFRLGNYDRTRPLTIDPVISYSTYVPTTVQAIAVDTAGAVYLTGNVYDSPDLPATPGSYDTTTDVSDAFVLKLDPTGSSLVYATYLGDCGYDSGKSIAVDASGNVYVSGTTSGYFPVTLDTRPSPWLGGLFVTKLNAAGGALLYSAILSGGTQSSSDLLRVDSAGRAYAAGTANGQLVTATTKGYSDAFVVRLNATGTAFEYIKLIGGSGNEGASALALDRDVFVYRIGAAKPQGCREAPGGKAPVVSVGLKKSYLPLDKRWNFVHNMICFSRISIWSGGFANSPRNWAVRGGSATKPGKNPSGCKGNPSGYKKRSSGWKRN